MGLPPERQPSLYDETEDPVVRAINTFMEITSWASAAKISKLPSSIENLSQRDFVLRQVMNMAPSKKIPVNFIEFSGNLVTMIETPLLTKESRIRLHDLLVTETGAEYMEAIGTIREIDLDKLKFYLRERPNDAPQLHCAVNEEMLDEAKAALGEKVKIDGIIERDKWGKVKMLKVKALEIMSDEDV